MSMENLNLNQEKKMSIEEIRSKHLNGEPVSPEDFMRLKEHDMKEDREEVENMYSREPIQKTTKSKKEKLQVYGWDNYK